ncbi:MAG TPA: hypothetical protein VFB58_14060 [Chloroflexota bacterium]|nr:hypothetical protein [Chloroflexota bacterium]
MPFDLSPLVPEARRPAGEAAAVYLRQTRPWLAALVVHGSALKGGFIPGCSDIDFQLWLREGAWNEGVLRLPPALAIQRDLAAVDVGPFQYIQGHARRAGRDIGPIPGTYHVLSGALPVPEATLEVVLDRCRSVLTHRHDYLASDLLDHGGGRLERTTRFVCTDVWPVLFSRLCLLENDLAVWRLTKAEMIARLPEPLRAEADRFHALVWAHYTGERTPDTALAVIAQGAEVIAAARRDVQ